LSALISLMAGLPKGVRLGLSLKILPPLSDLGNSDGYHYNLQAEFNKAGVSYLKWMMTMRDGMSSRKEVSMGFFNIVVSLA